MTEMLGMQKEEANHGFAKYIAKNYLDWVSPDNRDRHLMSPDIFKRKIFPLLDEGKKVFLIVIDNFRYDQWRMLAEDIGDLFDIDEQLYMSILPTATQYARNAIFSGLMPNKIAEMFPDLWVDEDEEEGKNLEPGAADTDPDRAIQKALYLQLSQGERFAGCRPLPGALQRVPELRPERAGD